MGPFLEGPGPRFGLAGSKYGVKNGSKSDPFLVQKGGPKTVKNDPFFPKSDLMTSGGPFLDPKNGHFGPLF